MALLRFSCDLLTEKKNKQIISILSFSSTHAGSLGEIPKKGTALYMYLKVKELAGVMFSKRWSLVNTLSMSSHGG